MYAAIFAKKLWLQPNQIIKLAVSIQSTEYVDVNVISSSYLHHYDDIGPHVCYKMAVLEMI